MSLPEDSSTAVVGTLLNGQIQGEDINSGKLITVDISGRITEIESFKDIHIVVIERFKYRITWYLNDRNPITRMACRYGAGPWHINRDKIVYQIATRIQIETWVDGDNRGPDEWRPIYTLHVWKDYPLPDADTTAGFYWKDI